MRTKGRVSAGVFAATLVVASMVAAEPPVQKISAASKAVRDAIDLKAADGCKHIYGFNYQPSWGHNGLTVWGEKFDSKRYREELAVGKKYFPEFNTVRIWLSWSSYREKPERFIRNFQQAVDICGELDLLVIPVMFNRWISSTLWERVVNPEIVADFDATFVPFVRSLVASHKGDLRILAWDLCNEPFIQGADNKKVPVSWERETQRLGDIRNAAKQCDPNALVCIGVYPSMRCLNSTAHLQDILTTHLYYPLYKSHPKSVLESLKNSGVRDDLIKNSFEAAVKLGKPMMSTECCWGSENDAERVSIIRTNLQALRRYKIAFFPHALWTSGVADLHRSPNYTQGWYMPFILEDGSLRPGHEVYNEFTR